MLSASLKKELKKIVNKSLDRSEEIWEKRNLKTNKFKNIKNIVPIFPMLKQNQFKTSDYFAVMIDMRGSMQHLRQDGGKSLKVHKMQRVFYEISALLPALTKIIQNKNGKITEYLGDGTIALFKASKNEKQNQKIFLKIIAGSFQCIQALEEIINPVLKKRYNFPKIQIGIGIAKSKVIICNFGLPPFDQKKVIGECIYFASRLSKGYNEIVIEKKLKKLLDKEKIKSVKKIQIQKISAHKIK